MKIKKYLAILLSSAMVLQMSVMAFANEDLDDHYARGSYDLGGGGIGSAELGSVGGGSEINHNEGSNGSESGGSGSEINHNEGSNVSGSGIIDSEINHNVVEDSGDAKDIDSEINHNVVSEDSGDAKDIDSESNHSVVSEDSGDAKEIEQKQEEPSEPLKPVEAEKEPEQKQEEPSEPQEPVEEAKEPEQKQEEPSEPQEPSTPEPQVSIVSTAAGNALPTSALGNAIANTKSVSLDLYNIEPAQYVNYFTAVISSVPQNGQAVIALNTESCLNRKIVDEIAARSDVIVNIIYKDKAGITKLIVIPAGANLSSLVDANGYIGFETLATAFGEKVLQ